jgi:hypothetical protein
MPHTFNTGTDSHRIMQSEIICLAALSSVAAASSPRPLALSSMRSTKALWESSARGTSLLMMVCMDTNLESTYLRGERC